MLLDHGVDLLLLPLVEQEPAHLLQLHLVLVLGLAYFAGHRGQHPAELGSHQELGCGLELPHLLEQLHALGDAGLLELPDFLPDG